MDGWKLPRSRSLYRAGEVKVVNNVGSCLVASRKLTMAVVPPSGARPGVGVGALGACRRARVFALTKGGCGPRGGPWVPQKWSGNWPT